MLSLISNRSAVLVGVFISVTTIPAAGNAAVAAVLGDWYEARPIAAAAGREHRRHRRGRVDHTRAAPGGQDLNREFPPHSHPRTHVVQARGPFPVADRGEFRGKGVAVDRGEPALRVERPVPGDVGVGRQRDRRIAGIARPLAGGFQQRACRARCASVRAARRSPRRARCRRPRPPRRSRPPADPRRRSPERRAGAPPGTGARAGRGPRPGTATRRAGRRREVRRDRPARPGAPPRPPRASSASSASAIDAGSTGTSRAAASRSG